MESLGMGHKKNGTIAHPGSRQASCTWSGCPSGVWLLLGPGLVGGKVSTATASSPLVIRVLEAVMELRLQKGAWKGSFASLLWPRVQLLVAVWVTEGGPD